MTGNTNMNVKNGSTLINFSMAVKLNPEPEIRPSVSNVYNNKKISENHLE